MLRFQSPPSSVSQKVPVKEPPFRFHNGGPYGESCPLPQPSFTCLSISSLQFSWQKGIPSFSRRP